MEDKTDHDRTVTPVVCRDTSHAQCHERSMLNEVDIDLPNSWIATCCCQCEGGGDVVGVLTLLVGGVAQACHDDRVVELRVQLGVQEVEGKDREEQVEVEKEKRVKEGAP